MNLAKLIWKKRKQKKKMKTRIELLLITKLYIIQSQ